MARKLGDKFYQAVGRNSRAITAYGPGAAMITALLAQGRMRQTGVVPVEKAIPGHVVLQEIRQRGIRITEKIRRWK